MNLFLLRHGETIESGYEEFVRPLSLTGERQAHIAGRFLKSSGIPPVVIMSSPLERAKRTAEIVGEELGIKDIVVTRTLIPGISERALIEKLNFHASTSTLLVGHEPQLRTFFTRMTGNSHARFEFRKGSLISIECPAPITLGSGTLRWFVTNEEMEISGTSP